MSTLRRIEDGLPLRPEGRDWRDDPEFIAMLEAIGGPGYLQKQGLHESDPVTYDAKPCAQCPRCGRTTLVIQAQIGIRKKNLDFCECRFSREEQIRRLEKQRAYDQQELAAAEARQRAAAAKIDTSQQEKVLKIAATRCKEQNLRDFGKCQDPTQRHEECKFCELYRGNKAKKWAGKRRAASNEKTA